MWEAPVRERSVGGARRHVEPDPIDAGSSTSRRCRPRRRGSVRRAAARRTADWYAAQDDDDLAQSVHRPAQEGDRRRGHRDAGRGRRVGTYVWWRGQQPGSTAAPSGMPTAAPSMAPDAAPAARAAAPPDAAMPRTAHLALASTPPGADFVSTASWSARRSAQIDAVPAKSTVVSRGHARGAPAVARAGPGARRRAAGDGAPRGAPRRRGPARRRRRRRPCRRQGACGQGPAPAKKKPPAPKTPVKKKRQGRSSRGSRLASRQFVRSSHRWGGRAGGAARRIRSISRSRSLWRWRRGRGPSGRDQGRDLRALQRRREPRRGPRRDRRPAAAAAGASGRAGARVCSGAIIRCADADDRAAFELAPDHAAAGRGGDGRRSGPHRGDRARGSRRRGWRGVDRARVHRVAGGDPRGSRQAVVGDTLRRCRGPASDA